MIVILLTYYFYLGKLDREDVKRGKSTHNLLALFVYVDHKTFFVFFKTVS